MTSSAVPLKTKNFPFDFASPAEGTSSVNGFWLASQQARFPVHFSALITAPMTLLLEKTVIYHVTLCKSNAVLTTEIAYQADIKKSRKTKTVLNMDFIWFTQWTGWERFGKGACCLKQKALKTAV